MTTHAWRLAAIQLFFRTETAASLPHPSFYPRQFHTAVQIRMCSNWPGNVGPLYLPHEVPPGESCKFTLKGIERGQAREIRDVDGAVQTPVV